MADQDDEDLQMALRMSLQTPPDAKRSKPRDNVEESPLRSQRELLAAAAEKRMLATPKSSREVVMMEKNAEDAANVEMSEDVSNVEMRDLKFGKELSVAETNQLFYMIFGDNVSREVLAQWTNQGIRFSSDPETCMGLVQHEGGPCGVLATIQAFVLKYLLFVPDELGKNTANLPSQNLDPSRFSQSDCVTLGNFASLTDDGKARALVQSMVEILFMCGSKRRAAIATVDVFHNHFGGSEDTLNDEIVLKSLEGLPLESTSDLQKVLRVNTYTSPMSAFDYLKTVLPFFRSRLGAMLFLISALLSRGLESVQADRDDPSLPLVTAPFGHASQEIVNLLLCGHAAPNVFDGRMDLGGDMFLKGIPVSVEVGFLSLLESLNFCKVGQNLKCPKWPIWVVGSESHYSVLFAFDTNVQNENESEARESLIRRAFDAQDQSGGGGFISVEGLHQVLQETNINLPQEKLDNLCSMGFIVWSEFWQLVLDLDKSSGGMKDSTGLMGSQLFDLYHFNGIAKSVLNGTQSTFICDSSLQRPRLSKLRVSVPPSWTPEEFMASAVPLSSGGEGSDEKVTVLDVMPPEPPQHAPLVDCIRTRWPRAVCNWVGDPPSIV